MSDEPRIALNYLLDHDDLPFECCDCQFATPDPDEERPNPADPGEGMYLCALLGEEEVKARNNNKACWTYGNRSVWGESPKCSRSDWRAKAREFVGNIEAVGISSHPTVEGLHAVGSCQKCSASGSGLEMRWDGWYCSVCGSPVS